MNSKLAILPLFLASGLGAVYLLPSAGAVAGSAVRMELPDRQGNWVLQKQQPSDKELEALAADTEFSKANCFRARPGEYNLEGYQIPDRLDLSIVLSGSDINNSIHRAERCMEAQGHVNIVGTDVPIQIANGRKLTARRLTSSQHIPLSADRKSMREMKCVTYYFFVGHDSFAHGHWERTFVDMKDRILRGMDQRWAYISVSMWIGEMPWNPGVEITEKEADDKIVAFLSDFSESQIDWDRIAP